MDRGRGERGACEARKREDPTTNIKMNQKESVLGTIQLPSIDQIGVGKESRSRICWSGLPGEMA